MDKENIDYSPEKINRVQEEIKKLNKKISDIGFELVGEDYETEENYEQEINNPQFEIDFLSKQLGKKEEELIELKMYEEIKINNEEYEQTKKNFKNGILISDKETCTDFLSRNLYSKIIAKYIVNKKTKTPFNIGIFGEWGEGKSSFLKFIEEEINKENRRTNEESYHTHIITYDATEYNEQNKIWSCILKQLFKKFETEEGYKARIKFSCKKFIKKLKSNLWKYSIRGISITFIVIWWCAFNYSISNLSQFNKFFLYGSLGIFPLIMGIINIIIPFIKSQIKMAKPLYYTIVTNMELPDYSKDLGTKENIKEDLKDLLDVWLKKEKNTDNYEERLVIFVDELDRCSDTGIIELLEALQLFLSIKEIVIVISINFNSVYYALREKMEYIEGDEVVNEKKIKFCINYLEKYISIPFYLSYDGEYDEYINNLLNDTTVKINDNIIARKEVAATLVQQEFLDTKGKFVFDIEEKNTIKEILNYANRLTHVTPRAVKRIINILILSKQICISINENANDLEKIQFDNYIKWFCFAYFNPKTSFKLQKIINKYKNYYTIKMIFNDLSKEEKQHLYTGDESNTKNLKNYLDKIRVNEIIMFKQISNYFILDYNEFIKG
ncbi:hypothetical protein FC820_07215 [Clostridium sporogenes]|uniref:KAP family P-loop NTPase fold protein n=1 Tax=Clostridium sporogenes TaxID=1509 RepID=UPI0013D20098|nr:P-loop NTPase fold protein [Clostridium sporogenes]NFE82323.1 hypothetical protein [Clostridium sporogenes]NFG68124.1 hypothetical protein [Clostridium sporogenes]